MVALVSNSRERPDRSDGDRERRLRNRNLAVAAILCGLVVLFYVVAIVKMSGG